MKAYVNIMYKVINSVVFVSFHILEVVREVGIVHILAEVADLVNSGSKKLRYLGKMCRFIRARFQKWLPVWFTTFVILTRL